MLKNSVALVSGCGGAFGKATAKRFVQEGARVIGLDLFEEKGSEIQEFEKGVLFYKADASNEDQVQQVMKQIEDKHGHLDIVVNCAGLCGTFPLFNPTKWTLDKFSSACHLLQHNTYSTFNVCRLAAPLLLKNTPDEDGNRGVIINTSGFLAVEGNLTQSFMSGVLGATNSMTLALARDFADDGVRVVTISPGIFASPTTSYWPKSVYLFFNLLTPCPHRMGQVEEYADQAVAIINNKMLNGVVIRLDGGYRNHI